MKPAIIALALVASPAFARVMPPPPAAKVAAIDFNLESNEGFRFATITLDASGKAVVETFRASFDQPRAVRVATKTIKLKSELAASLLQDAQTIADAELETITHEHVCMLFAPFMGASSDLKVAQDYDYETQRFSGKLETALSGGGCWRPTTISPKEDWAKNIAHTLKGKLEAIGLDAAGK